MSQLDTAGRQIARFYQAAAPLQTVNAMEQQPPDQPGSEERNHEEEEHSVIIQSSTEAHRRRTRDVDPVAFGDINAAPEPPDEDVVAPCALAVHADRNAVAGKLATSGPF